MLRNRREEFEADSSLSRKRELLAASFTIEPIIVFLIS
jgi:hypothetical protein